MRVTLIGCGGIGSHLADWVARFLAHHAGDHAFTLVDGDGYEERNASRQTFDRPGNKAQVTVERLAQRFPRLTLSAVAEYVKPDNVDFILLEDEIVLAAVDNHATRKLVSDTAGKLANVSVISGGNELTDGTVQIYLRRDGRNLTPSLTQDHPEIADPQDRSPHELSCEELAQAGAEQILFTNLTAAVIMANALWRLTVRGPESFVADRRGTPAFSLERAYTEAAFDMESNLVQTRLHPVEIVSAEQPVTPTQEERAS